MSGPGYRIAHLDEIPAVPAAGGLEWRGIRNALGVQSFGINAYTSSEAGQDVVEDHDETGVGAGRHEELYIVISGHAQFTVAVRTWTRPLARWYSSATRRCAATRSPPSRHHGCGAGRHGRRAVPRPGRWEWSFRAEPLARAGEHAKAREIMEEGLEQYPENPAMLYNAACFTALAGDADDAVEYLRRAFAADPGRVRSWAAADTDLDSLRERPDYPVS